MELGQRYTKRTGYHCPCGITRKDGTGLRNHYINCQLHQIYLCPVQTCDQHLWTPHRMSQHMAKTHQGMNAPVMTQAHEMLERGRRTVMLSGLQEGQIKPNGRERVTILPGRADFRDPGRRSAAVEACMVAGAPLLATPLLDFFSGPPMKLAIRAAATLFTAWDPDTSSVMPAVPTLAPAAAVAPAYGSERDSGPTH